MKKENIKIPWIKVGYHFFAFGGPKDLKIESLSKTVGKNKSSFYYLFTDTEIFISHLLKFHLEQASLIAEKEANCTTLKELIDILIYHKIDLLFNRQLRIHRQNKEFEQCFLKTNKLTGKAILKIWSEIIDLKENSYLAELVLKLSIENFYLQITEETLNQSWLNNYFIELRVLVKAFKNNPTYQVLKR